MATITVSADVIVKAGAGVGAVPPAAWDRYIEQAEGTVEAASRYNFTGNWATISANAKLVQQVVEDLAAICGIVYNMSGYTSRIEAEDLINVLRDAALRGLSILRDKKTQDFINGA